MCPPLTINIQKAFANNLIQLNRVRAIIGRQQWRHAISSDCASGITKRSISIPGTILYSECLAVRSSSKPCTCSITLDRVIENPRRMEHAEITSRLKKDVLGMAVRRRFQNVIPFCRCTSRMAVVFPVGNFRLEITMQLSSFNPPTLVTISTWVDLQLFITTIPLGIHLCYLSLQGRDIFEVF